MNIKAMTQAEYARHRGVLPSAVSNWKKRNLLVFTESESGKSLVDVVRSDSRVNAKIDPTRGRPTSTQAGTGATPSTPVPAVNDDGLGRVRTDLIVAQTVEKTMKNAKMAGELVSLADYETRVSEYGRLIRERMQALVRTNSERLAAERDPRALTTLLSAEIDMALTDLADSILSRLMSESDDEIGTEEIEELTLVGDV